VKFTNCRLVNYKLVGRFPYLLFHEHIPLSFNHEVHFYKCRFHFTAVVNLENEQISVLALPFFYIFLPCWHLASQSHCCLVSFLLARPFSFFGHFFIYSFLRRFFSNNWFDWCFILIQSDLNFFPLLTSCLSNSLSPCCQLIFFLLDHFRFFYHFFLLCVLSCTVFFICNLFELRDILISQFISCP
jgi:hypothetical protein